MGSGQPYRQFAQEYFHKGWIPIPLPPGEKHPPPKESTGHYDKPDYDKIMYWINSEPKRSNIGLRTPDGLIGIDIDAYNTKQGARTFGLLVDKFGPLPETWTLSARADGLSGIRFYRVPTGKVWPGELGPDVQIIQFRHRYAVAWPSIHPGLQKMYRWYAPGAPIDGESFADRIPDISKLAGIK